MTDDPHELGPVLAFAEHRDHEPPTGSWQPLTDRVADAELGTRIQRIRDTFGSRRASPVDLRVAASTEHLGLVARLVAAHICGRAVGTPVDLAVASLWCREVPGRLLQLSCVHRTKPANPLERSAIRDLTDRIEQLYAVSPKVLWGNIGSAANSTLNLLRTSRPDLQDAARIAADGILQDPRVDGGTLRAGPAFRRRSCCLVYRAIDGVCGDCVLQR